MADDMVQDRRGSNLLIKRLEKTDNLKTSITHILFTKLYINIFEDIIKYAAIINNRQATNQDTESYRISFFDRNIHDIIYLKQTHEYIYISEDLTMA